MLVGKGLTPVCSIHDGTDLFRLPHLARVAAQTSVSEEHTGAPLLLAQGQTQEEEGENNGERVKAYLADHPKATLREIAGALTISVTTARKWRSRVQGGGVQASAKK